MSVTAPKGFQAAGVQAVAIRSGGVGSHHVAVDQEVHPEDAGAAVHLPRRCGRRWFPAIDRFGRSDNRIFQPSRVAAVKRDGPERLRGEARSRQNFGRALVGGRQICCRELAIVVRCQQSKAHGREVLEALADIGCIRLDRRVRRRDLLVAVPAASNGT